MHSDIQKSLLDLALIDKSLNSISLKSISGFWFIGEHNMFWNID